jgi:type II secretory pathway component PulF
MFSPLRSYQVSYLLASRADASAKLDPISGMYKHSGLLVGDSDKAIVSQIRQLGGLPIDVQLVKPRLAIFTPVTRGYKDQFLTAVSFNSATMSAAKALEAVIMSDQSAMREIMNPALAIIQRGGSFMEAMEALGIFDESTIAILEAGERMGQLRTAIATAVEHLRNRQSTNKIMMGMVTLAGFEVSMAVSSLLANRYGMLPKMEQNIPTDMPPDKVKDLLAAIHFGIVTNDIMIWGTGILIVVALLGWYAYFDKDQNFRKWVDDKVMLIPALSGAILHAAVANSFRIAASLVAGGVKYTTALEIARNSTRVPRVRDFWKEALTRSDAGDSVAATLNQPLLDNSDRLVIGAHSDRHVLAKSMTVIAEKREMFAKVAAKRFGILLFMAMLVYTVGAVVVSLYVMWIQNASLFNGLT